MKTAKEILIELADEVESIQTLAKFRKALNELLESQVDTLRKDAERLREENDRLREAVKRLHDKIKETAK